MASQKGARAAEVASENGRAASWQSSRQNLTPPGRGTSSRTRLLADIGAFWHQFYTRRSTPTAELHYMRGLARLRAKHVALRRTCIPLNMTDI